VKNKGKSKKKRVRKSQKKVSFGDGEIAGARGDDKLYSGARFCGCAPPGNLNLLRPGSFWVDKNRREAGIFYTFNKVVRKISYVI